MRICKIGGNIIECSLIGVDDHSFGRRLSIADALPYVLEVSADDVLINFNEYYQDFIDRESEDEGFEEELTGNYLLLRETCYLSLESMIHDQPNLLADILFKNLPSEFFGCLFYDKDILFSKKYILQTVVNFSIINGIIRCEGEAFINPRFGSVQNSESELTLP